MTDIETKISEWIDAHAGEILETIQASIRIPSVKGSPEPDAPFGRETRNALDHAMRAGERWGLKGKHIDGYAIHMDWLPEGVLENAPVVGVLAHVDVVPAGSGWVRDPFGAVVEDGILYGRGAIDDKGPAFAAFFGVIAARECGAPSKRRVRIIFGADEESGFGCMRYYFAHEPMPDIGFTPDAIFPLIFAEKGVLNIVLGAPIASEAGPVSLTALNGGNRPNMVPDKAIAELRGEPNALEEVARKLSGIESIETQQSGDVLIVTATGKSAHAMAPEDGVNAIAVLAGALTAAGLPRAQAAFAGVLKEWAGGTDGGVFGVDWKDEVSGPLTCNLGVASTEDGRLHLTFNIRYPVTDNVGRIREGFEMAGRMARFELESLADSPPLYVPQDDPLLVTLLDVYRKQTGDMSPPIAIGGGTYARVMRKGVAFGPELPGNPTCAHQPDEHWPVAQILAAAKIYALAVARLINLPLG